jgi:hypothetical protein
MPALAWSALGKSRQTCYDSWPPSQCFNPERSELKEAAEEEDDPVARDARQGSMSFLHDIKHAIDLNLASGQAELLYSTSFPYRPRLGPHERTKCVRYNGRTSCARVDRTLVGVLRYHPHGLNLNIKCYVHIHSSVTSERFC